MPFIPSHRRQKHPVAARLIYIVPGQARLLSETLSQKNQNKKEVTRATYIYEWFKYSSYKTENYPVENLDNSTGEGKGSVQSVIGEN